MANGDWSRLAREIANEVRRYEPVQRGIEFGTWKNAEDMAQQYLSTEMLPRAEYARDMLLRQLQAMNRLTREQVRSQELGKIHSVLAANRDKTFVSRIERPQEFPSMRLGPGEYGTHLMSYDDRPGGGYMVYPEIIFDHRSGKLRQLSRADARQHAVLTGNYIPFKSKAEADWFSKSYKKVWRGDTRPKQVPLPGPQGSLPGVGLSTVPKLFGPK